jgi:CHAT domain-containing protein/tetratricopeptide (TPR) repeat protein
MVDAILEENRHPYLFVAELVVQAAMCGRGALRASGLKAECLLWALYALSVIATQDPEIRYSDDLAEAHLLLLEEMRGIRGSNIEVLLRKARELSQDILDRHDESAVAMMEVCLSHVLVRAGQFDLARQHLESATSRMQPDRQSLIWAVRCCVLAEVEGNSSRLSEARIAAEEAEALYRRKGRMRQAFEIARNIGEVFLLRSTWSDAAACLQRAVEAANAAYSSQLLGSQRDAWLGDVGGTYREAGYALARNNQAITAAVILEQGRARALNNALPCDRLAAQRIQMLDPGAYALYVDAASRLRRLDTPGVRISFEDRWEEVGRAGNQLHDAIDRIRRLPGYEHFLTEASFEELSLAVTPERPIIYVATTAVGSLALILHRREVGSQVVAEAIWLNDFRQDSLTAIMDGEHGWRHTWDRRSENLEKWKTVLDHVMESLWSGVMGPIVDWLTQQGYVQATLIPAGQLGLLPLHAAWTWIHGCPRRYALNDIVFSYAPSARVLLRSLTMRKGTNQQVLLVDNPGPLAPESARPLKFSSDEIEAVASVFVEPKRLGGADATREAVMEALREAEIVHFSCHGRACIGKPMESGLLMAYDKYVTVGDLFEVKGLGGQLAALSACDAGVIGETLPDEVIGLPVAFARAGYTGVLASLWEVDERSTALLMQRFYDLWWKRGFLPAKALRCAQQWVRDASIKEKAAYCSLRGRKTCPHRTTESLCDYLVRCRPDFSHPYYWAGFYLTGI